MTTAELARRADVSSPADILALAADAGRVRTARLGAQPALCSLVSIRSGACPEDCRYCAQSAHWAADPPTWPMASADVITERAQALEPAGASHVCLVASGRGPDADDLATVCEAAGRIRRATAMRVCACLGLLSRDQAVRLRDAGVVRVNHNLESSSRFYPFICTTHGWEERYDTAQAVKQAGLELCSGGILGLGESDADRLALLLALRDLDPEVVPINVLNPRPGTPLADAVPPTPLEAVKWLALARLALPGAAIKLAGGRESGLRTLQGLALLAGANGLIIGGYLTTGGRPVTEDRALLRDCGFRA